MKLLPSEFWPELGRDLGSKACFQPLEAIVDSVADNLPYLVNNTSIL